MIYALPTSGSNAYAEELLVLGQIVQYPVDWPFPQHRQRQNRGSTSSPCSLGVLWGKE